MREEGGPGGEAFARVDEDALGPGADEVGVCAWSGLVSVVAWVSVACVQHGGSTLQGELHAHVLRLA